MRTHIALLALLLGCGSAPEAPRVKLTPQLEAQLAAVGGECTSLKRIGGEPGAAPNVLQCKSPTAYLSVNSFDGGQIHSIELALTGQPAELRKLYAKAFDQIAGADAIGAIQLRIPDGGVAIETPELGRVAGVKLMISSARAGAAWRYDVTINW